MTSTRDSFDLMGWLKAFTMQYYRELNSNMANNMGNNNVDNDKRKDGIHSDIDHQGNNGGNNGGNNSLITNGNMSRSLLHQVAFSDHNGSGRDGNNGMGLGVDIQHIEQQKESMTTTTTTTTISPLPEKEVVDDRGVGVDQRFLATYLWPLLVGNMLTHPLDCLCVNHICDVKISYLPSHSYILSLPYHFTYKVSHSRILSLHTRPRTFTQALIARFPHSPMTHIVARSIDPSCIPLTCLLRVLAIRLLSSRLSTIIVAPEIVTREIVAKSVTVLTPAVFQPAIIAPVTVATIALSILTIFNHHHHHHHRRKQPRSCYLFPPSVSILNIADKFTAQHIYLFNLI